MILLHSKREIDTMCFGRSVCFSRSAQRSCWSADWKSLSVNHNHRFKSVVFVSLLPERG